MHRLCGYDVVTFFEASENLLPLVIGVMKGEIPCSRKAEMMCEYEYMGNDQFLYTSSEKRRCFCRRETSLSKAALSLYDLAVASFVDGPTIWNLGLFWEDFSIWVIIPHGVIRFIELKFSVSMHSGWY